VVNTNPEIVDLTIGSDCNLTCSYCCKEYSSAWRRDLVTHGNYDVQSDANRFALTVKDTVLMKFSQSALKSTLHYQSLLNEIKLVAPTLKKLIVTGGEPFLDNQLIETIRQLPFSKDCKIQMYTGLGVNVSRFEKILNRLKTVDNLYLTVSAECTNQLHEFNRYGSSWLDFEHKIQLIRKHGIKYEFQSTLSNLTVFGFANFAKQFKDDTIRITFAYQPNMMAPYVLDSTSKQVIIEQLQLLPESMKNQIVRSMSAEPTESQRQGIKQFLTEFVNRRKDLDITIYPKHFLNWISYVV
jgi:organic radical activating enzyme